MLHNSLPKQNEKAIEFNEKFIYLTDNMSGYGSYINAETLKYEFINKAFHSGWGLTREEVLLSQLEKRGIKKENIEIRLAGGANVLKRENDTIGKDNLDSIEKLFRENQLEFKAKSIGGFERRTVLFDIGKRCIYYTVGDSNQKVLWQTGSK